MEYASLAFRIFLHILFLYLICSFETGFWSTVLKIPQIHQPFPHWLIHMAACPLKHLEPNSEAGRVEDIDVRLVSPLISILVFIDS